MQKALTKLKKLCKNPMKSLIILFMFLVVNQIVRTIKKIMFMLLNLLGQLIINLAPAVLSSRFRKIGKIILSLLLMYPNVIALSVFTAKSAQGYP